MRNAYLVHNTSTEHYDKGFSYSGHNPIRLFMSCLSTEVPDSMIHGAKNYFQNSPGTDSCQATIWDRTFDGVTCHSIISFAPVKLVENTTKFIQNKLDTDKCCKDWICLQNLVTSLAQTKFYESEQILSYREYTTIRG